MTATPERLVLGNSPEGLAARAKQRIDEAISQGRTHAGRVIKRVMETLIVDRLAPSGALSFQPRAHDVKVTAGEASLDVHPNALRQLAERAHLPMGYVSYLLEQDSWGQDLLAESLQRIYRNVGGTYLLRSVEGRLMGFLSDRYRRMDSRAVLESFSGACTAVGALPYQGYAADTRFAVQAILPKMYEPIPNEYIALGVSLEDSQFGNGPTQVSMFVLRAVCLNGMIATRAIRQVHLGRQTRDDMLFAQDTYEAESKTLALKVRDVIQASLSEENINSLQASVRRAHERKIDPAETATGLKKVLPKATAEKVVERFNTPDVELLPPGNTYWRLSNTISWLAGQSTDAEETLLLQRAAGQYLAI